MLLKSGMGYQLDSKTYPGSCFKETIRTKRIEILEAENSYADIVTSFNKMEN